MLIKTDTGNSMQQPGSQYTHPGCKNVMRFIKRPFLVQCSKCGKTIKGIKLIKR